jgi:hypothetical protein
MLFAAPALLLFIIFTSLLTLIQSQCLPTNVTACTTCESCTSRSKGYWYSASPQCGGAVGRCVKDQGEIPCFDGFGNSNYYTTSSTCDTCYKVNTNVLGHCWEPPNLSCSSSSRAGCMNSTQCRGIGKWINSDSSPSFIGKDGMCMPLSETAPCNSWEITASGGSGFQASASTSCSSISSCLSCVAAFGQWITPLTGSSEPYCSRGMSTCGAYRISDGYYGSWNRWFYFY